MNPLKYQFARVGTTPIDSNIRFKAPLLSVDTKLVEKPPQKLPIMITEKEAYISLIAKARMANLKKRTQGVTLTSIQKRRMSSSHLGRSVTVAGFSSEVKTSQHDKHQLEQLQSNPFFVFEKQDWIMKNGNKAAENFAENQFNRYWDALQLFEFYDAKSHKFYQVGEQGEPVEVEKSNFGGANPG
jgi:hypothetical protein